MSPSGERCADYEVDPTTTKIRIISARKTTQNEIRQYEESL
jgi:uncharacterized DUF497 family protein